ncbi:MAG: hypothetical protein HBSAPP01_24730 [Candidatus Brocadia sapporoensis]|nr:MAG: hypothetical protein HBSAPP01_24730 [Candidatus Brocadia sapporoensis]
MVKKVVEQCYKNTDKHSLSMPPRWIIESLYLVYKSYMVGISGKKNWEKSHERFFGGDKLRRILYGNERRIVKKTVEI